MRADLNPRWELMSEGTFSDVMALIINVSTIATLSLTTIMVASRRSHGVFCTPKTMDGTFLINQPLCVSFMCSSLF